MRAYDVILKKRNGEILSIEEIRWLISSYAQGDVPDYQMAAFCMAVYFQGMNAEETAALTFAVRDSGDILDLCEIDGLRVDKHSTGGVGDKTSLIVAPIVASLGVKVAKMSGRGLGHTGGTIDKLESIEGLKTAIPLAEFKKIVKKVGLAIVGQSAELAPADKKLYALRDVTATVDSLPLIVSSIMGKKLAADDDCIVLDVKTGNGAFMKSLQESVDLAVAMVEIGKRAGKKTRAVVSDMSTPLGRAIGNSLEVVEAIYALQGKIEKDLEELCICLSAHILSLANKGSIAECEQMAREVLHNGKALAKFAEMVEAQGGNPEWIYRPELFPKATYEREVLSPQDGYIVETDTEGYGAASLLLGAGRNTKEEAIDHAAGIVLHAKRGECVRKGEKIATLYTNDLAKLEIAAEKLLSATVLGATPPPKLPLIYKVVE